MPDSLEGSSVSTSVVAFTSVGAGSAAVGSSVACPYSVAASCSRVASASSVSAPAGVVMIVGLPVGSSGLSVSSGPGSGLADVMTNT